MENFPTAHIGGALISSPVIPFLGLFSKEIVWVHQKTPTTKLIVAAFAKATINKHPTIVIITLVRLIEYIHTMQFSKEKIINIYNYTHNIHNIHHLNERS